MKEIYCFGVCTKPFNYICHPGGPHGSFKGCMDHSVVKKTPCILYALGDMVYLVFLSLRATVDSISGLRSIGAPEKYEFFSSLFGVEILLQFKSIFFSDSFALIFFRICREMTEKTRSQAADFLAESKLTRALHNAKSCNDCILPSRECL